MSTAALTPTPKMQFSDANGVPLAGGKVYSYAAGTSTALATFTDSTETAQNTNPIILDAGGFANIWLGSAFYKFVVQDALGIQLYTTDNVSSSNLPFNTTINFVEGTPSTGPIGSDTIQASLALHRLVMSNNGGAPDAIVGQNTTDTLTNKTLINAILTNPSLNSISSLNPSYLFAELQPGSDASAKIQAAINALPSAGGIVDATNLSDPGGTGSTTIDPGQKTVRLMLGPQIYHFTQVICRTGFQCLGMGTGNGLAGTKPPTLIQAMGGNATSPFVLGQTANEGQEDIILRGFRLIGAVGNTTQNGIDLQAGTLGGLWYSELDDLNISGFGGISLNLVGSTASAGGIAQFSTFRRICAFRVSGGSYALQIKGFCNSLKFENCQFDGSPAANGGDNLTNINIQDDAGCSFPPYNIKFDLLTCQWAGVGVQVNGCDSLSFDQLHMEGVHGAIQVGTGASFGSFLTVHDSWFGNATGVNAGNGFIINHTGATANDAIQIINSRIYTVPDLFLKGNTDSIAQYGNTIGPEGTYLYQSPRAPFVIPQVMAGVDLLALSAASGVATILTPATSGIYRLTAYLLVVTPAGTSSTLGNVTITWTDATDSVAQSQVMMLATEAGASATTNAGNTTASKLTGSLMINAKAAVPVQYSIAYASNAANAMIYQVHLKIERLF